MWIRGLIAGLVIGTGAVAQENPPRPNVLWIIGEDLGPELGCDGTPEARTPHLDGLAARGIRFTHAFMTAPVCSTSRSSFMTGMYATTIDAHQHRSHREDGYRLPDGVHLLTEWLRDTGYRTANIRQLTDDPKERFYRGTGKTDWNFTAPDRPFDTDRWTVLKSQQPFFAQINFSETHRGGAWDRAHEHIEHPADPAKVRVPRIYPDHPLVRADWAQYLNAVMALDLKVGRVLELLERDGLAENTIVFFFGDHGRAMVRGKQWPYDSGVRVPLIIAWPKEIPSPADWKPGSVSQRLVSGIDLPATTLALAGVPRPPLMQGRVFLGDEADPPRQYAFSTRDRCDETVFRIRSVRDAQYRYLRNFMPERPFLQINRYKEWSYPVLGLLRELHAAGELEGPAATLMAPNRPAEELYDLVNDPDEVHNLAGSEEHQAAQERLRAALDTWIVETNDRGRFAEAAEEIAKWEAQMKKNYDAKLKRRAEKKQ